MELACFNVFKAKEIIIRADIMYRGFVNRRIPLFSHRESAMRIDNEIEYRAAKDVFKKYHFQPHRSKSHPLQESMEVIAKAVKNYECARDFSTGVAASQAA